MSHYEQRLQIDMDAIRDRLRATCRDVEAAIGNATRALLARDADAASRTALGDLPINRTIRSIDHLCHVFVARHSRARAFCVSSPRSCVSTSRSSASATTRSRSHARREVLALFTELVGPIKRYGEE